MTASQLLAEQPTTTTAHNPLEVQVNTKKPIRHCRPLHDRAYRLSLVSFLLRKLAGSAGWANPAWEVIVASNRQVNFSNELCHAIECYIGLRILYLHAVGSLHAVMAMSAMSCYWADAAA